MNDFIKLVHWKHRDFPAMGSVCRLKALLNQADLSIGVEYANKRKKMSFIWQAFHLGY